MARSIGLLVADDPEPVSVQNTGGASSLVLVGDHAGVAIPARLGDLGLSRADVERHIACDIGVANLGAELAQRLDATFISQRYSRLVIDCNRALGSEGSILTESDGTVISGNMGIGPDEASARAEAIFTPYHQRIAAELDQRQGQGRRTIFVALHSFTPAMAGRARPWRYGLLHRQDSPFSKAMLVALRALHDAEVGDNQPYAMDGTDFTVPFHADPRGLDYLEIEVRQDLISTPEGVARTATELAAVFDSPMN